MINRFGLPVLLAGVLAGLVLLPVGILFLTAATSGALLIPGLRPDGIAEFRALLPYLDALSFSLSVAALAAVLSGAAGVALAWLAVRTDVPAKAIVEACIIAPLFLSPLVGAIAWRILAAPVTGLLNSAAFDGRGLAAPVMNIATPAGAIFVMVLYYVPYAYLAAASALRKMDPALEEAAYVNGSGVPGATWRVTLPIIEPAVLGAVFFIFVLGCGSLAIPAILDPAGHLPFLTAHIYRDGAIAPQNPDAAAAIAAVLFWIVVLGMTASRFAAHMGERFETKAAYGSRARLVRLQGWTMPALGAVAFYALLSVVLPCLALLWCTVARSGAAVFQPHVSAEKALAFSASAAVRGAATHTLEVGVTTATLCVVLGLLVAYAVRRMRVPGGRVLHIVVLSTIAVPGIVLGVGVRETYQFSPLAGTVWLLVLAFSASYLPFAYRIADVALARIDPSLEEASALCGADHRRTLARITLVLVRPAMLSAWLTVLVFAMRELGAAALLTSPGNTVLSVLALTTLHDGDMSKLAVIALVQAGLMAIIVASGRLLFGVRLFRMV